MNVKFGSCKFSEKPIVDILLAAANKLWEKSLLKLKKRKKMKTTIKR